MKSLIFGCILILSLLSINIYLYFEVEKSTKEIDSMIDIVIDNILDDDISMAKSNFEKIEEKTNEYIKTWQIVTNHSEIDEVEAALKYIEGYLKTNEKIDSIAYLHALKFYVTNIFQREKINFPNIF